MYAKGMRMTNIHGTTTLETPYEDLNICKQPRTEVAKKAKQEWWSNR